MLLPLTSTHKDRILVHLREGLLHEVIAEVEGIQVATVRKIRVNFITWGLHTAPRMSLPGPPSLIHNAVRIDLRHYLEAQPWAYQDEMQYYIFDDWGIVVRICDIQSTSKHEDQPQMS